MAAPFLLQRQQVAVKIEGTEGTDAVPTDSDVVHPAYDTEWAPSFTQFERDNVQSSLSRLTQIQGERSATISLSAALKGSGVAGTPPPQLSALLQSCGFSETIVASTSVTYALATEDVPSATVEIREGSVGSNFMQKKIVGARGTVSIQAVKGQPVLVVCTFTGRVINPTSTAISAFTTPTFLPKPVSFLSAGFSFHSVGTLKVQNVTLDVGNDVQLRNDVNQASGNFSAVIVGRSPIGNIDPEQELTATIDFFNRLINETEGSLTYALTGSAGNITTVTAPKAQILNLSDGDRNGLRLQPLDLQLSQDVAAGDDELSIVFT